MLLTREADYAVLCILEVARAGHVSAGEIADRQGVSAGFLANIVHSLAKAGIAVTRRGAGGGITLARSPYELTVLEVVEAVQGPLGLNACVARPLQCPRTESCVLFPTFLRARDALRASLAVSFGDLLDAERAGVTIDEVRPGVAGGARP